MADLKKILRRVAALEAAAALQLQEATSLKKELEHVYAPAPRNGRYTEAIAKVGANIEKNMRNRKSRIK